VVINAKKELVKLKNFLKEKRKISIEDPDARVAGKGIKLLKEAGIEVHLGLCKKESLDLNKAFIHRHITKKAFGVLKWAMSIDGRIALKNGKSKWITNNESRSLVHSFRAEFDAIIIGGNTLRRDNPLLTSRRLKGMCIWSSINLRANFDPTTVIFWFNSKRLHIKPE